MHGESRENREAAVEVSLRDIYDVVIDTATTVKALVPVSADHEQRLRWVERIAYGALASVSALGALIGWDRVVG